MSEPKTYQEVWQNCLKFIKDNLDPQPFATWFEPIKPIQLTDKRLRLLVPSQFFVEYIEGNYASILATALRKELGPTASLDYEVVVVQGVAGPQSNASMMIPGHSPSRPQNVSVTKEIINPFAIPGIKHVDPQLNPEYSFDHFIEGACNRLSRAAGQALATAKGKCAYSPLFIHGGSGMGKTHLAQAIGLEAKRCFPDKSVLYVNASRFQVQFTDSRMNNTFNDFFHFYQNIDLLILDDVHELAGKEKTQEAYFQIFNHLHQHGKQLVLTSDQSPAVLSGVQERLLSRFKWGLQSDLQMPDFDTRFKILQHKAMSAGIDLPLEVMQYMAENITYSIRELEGALVSLIAQSTLNKRDINMELATDLVEKQLRHPVKEPSLNKIQSIVCEYFGLPEGALAQQTRKREIVQARHIAFYLARTRTKQSLSTIGSSIGNKDHATVNHGCKVAADLIQTDRRFKQFVEDIEKQLTASMEQ